MKYFLLIYILTLSLGATSQNLNLGLRAYYPFSGNANDVSGNNNHAAFNNATLTADAAGTPNSAYHFNGTSSYMRIANAASINMTNQISICVMVHPQGFYMGTCHGNSVMMKGTADFASGNYIIRFDDAAYTSAGHCANPTVDVVHQNFYGNSDLFPVYSPYIQLNEWYSVVYTYDGTTVNLYINCELKRSTAVAGMTFTNAADLYFATTPLASYPYWFNGDLDEIRLYNRALTPAEVILYGACKVTAVNFMDFSLSPNKRSVLVNWSATNEETGMYTVERAEKGCSDFKPVFQQPMQGGPTVHQYSYRDNNVMPGTTYQYRIHSMENGVSSYSAIKTASVEGKISVTHIDPNPSTGLFTIHSEGLTGSASVTVFNADGKKISLKAVKDLAKPFTIDLTHSSPGIYIMKILTNSGLHTSKLVVK